MNDNSASSSLTSVQRHPGHGEPEPPTVSPLATPSSENLTCHLEPETTIYPEGTDLYTDVQCPKNPGHQNFIPVDKFTKDHFPIGYRDQWRVDLVKAQADLTVYLFALKVSENRLRQQGKPDSSNFCDKKFKPRKGTGYVMWVHKCGEGGKWDEDKVCCCRDCKRSSTPRKTWWKATVATAAHVTCDKFEVADTEVCFFKGENAPHSRRGEGDMEVIANMEDDWCRFDVVVHDEEVGERLMRALECYRKLSGQLREGGPVVIVSHPHGLQKCVTLGELLKKEDHPLEGKRWPRYTYSCDTCQGSSGAGVVGGDCKWGRRIPHRGGLEDGSNQSTYGWGFL